MRVWAVDIGIQRNNRCKGSTFLRMMRLVKNKIQQLTSSLSQLADRNFPSAPNEICRTAGSVDRERLQCAVKSIHAKPIRYPTYLLFVFTQTRHIFSYQIGETVQTDFCRLFVLVLFYLFFTSIFSSFQELFMEAFCHVAGNVDKKNGLESQCRKISYHNNSSQVWLSGRPKKTKGN